MYKKIIIIYMKDQNIFPKICRMSLWVVWIQIFRYSDPWRRYNEINCKQPKLEILLFWYIPNSVNNVDSNDMSICVVYTKILHILRTGGLKHHVKWTITCYAVTVFGLRKYLTIICSPHSTIPVHIRLELSIIKLSIAIHDPSARFSWVNFQNIEKVLDKNFFFTFFG